MKKRVVVVGAGGFAREVAWLISDLEAAGEAFHFEGFVVSDLDHLGEFDSHDQILGDFSWLEANRTRFESLAMGIGNPATKAKLVGELDRRYPDADWPVLIHPSAKMNRTTCGFERGVVICAGVIGTVNLVFSEFSMLNLSCTVGHEAEIGAYAALNPTVNLSGGVVLGREVLVGTGAQILQYVRIGDGASIGAGAVVTKNVSPGITVVGIPARPLNK